jgi:hypothetical protein
MRSAIAPEMKIDVKLGSDHPSEFVDKKPTSLEETKKQKCLLLKNLM